MNNNLVLLIDSPDEAGLVFKITKVILENSLNIMRLVDGTLSRSKII